MKKIAAGIMSGTSLDGIDVALAFISGVDEKTKIEFLDGLTISWQDKTYDNIKAALSLNNSNVELISKLNYQIAFEYYNALNILCERNNIKTNDLLFVAAHGQTIWHDPFNEERPSTLQIGSGAVLSTLSKTTVVSNFREKDLVIGGQGAPLVPFVDQILFNSKDKIISAHNLGGISNLTILENNEIKLAFDTGPANMMIDYYMQTLFNESYDNEGKRALTGKLIKPLYDEVMALSFFNEAPPKSTGRELFGAQYSKYLFDKYPDYKTEDYVHTATLITVDSIVNSYLKLIKNYKITEIIFSGGGAHNTYLLNEIAKKLPMIKIKKSTEYNVSVDFKEALAFIVLGNQTFNLKTTNLKKATGSNKPLIIGEISY